MSGVELRPYQREAVDAVLGAPARGVRRPLVKLPTGTGKTIVFAEVIRRRGGRALVIAHREELLEQARDKLHLVAPDLGVGIVQAEHDEHQEQVVVASVATLARQPRLHRLLDGGGAFSTIVVDEAHHATARTYREALAQMGGFEVDGPLVMGVTATPERADGVGLHAVFDQIVFDRDILAMIRAGYLCDLRAVRVKVDVDLDRLHIRAGDFGDEELGEEMQRAHAPEQALEAYREHGDGRKTLVFTPTVQLAGEMADTFAAAGIESAVVSGGTPAHERHEILERFRAGEVRVLANCAVLTEGYDDPTVECLILARPTKSRPLYVQMLGRGTRTAPGKDDCLVLDLVGSTQRHQLVTVESLFGLDPDRAKGKPVTEALDDQIREAGERVDPSLALVSQEVDLFARRELHWSLGKDTYVLAAGDHGNIVVTRDRDGWSVAVVGRGTYQSIGTGLDLGYAQGLAEDTVRRWRADRLVRADARWRSRPVTEKQLQLLNNKGIPTPDGMTAGEASDLLSLHITGRALEPATARQRYRLRQMGIDCPPDMTKGLASFLIGRAMEGVR